MPTWNEGDYYVVYVNPDGSETESGFKAHTGAVAWAVHKETGERRTFSEIGRN